MIIDHNLKKPLAVAYGNYIVEDMQVRCKIILTETDLTVLAKKTQELIKRARIEDVVYISKSGSGWISVLICLIVSSLAEASLPGASDAGYKQAYKMDLLTLNIAIINADRKTELMTFTNPHISKLIKVYKKLYIQYKGVRKI